MKKISKKQYGEAFCKLNNWEWSEVFGEKPIDFDDLPHYSKEDKSLRTKYTVVTPYIKECKKHLHDYGTSYYWWKIVLRRPWYKWMGWYFIKRPLIECRIL
jgi:hypothetical protein